MSTSLLLWAALSSSWSVRYSTFKYHKNILSSMWGYILSPIKVPRQYRWSLLWNNVSTPLFDDLWTPQTAKTNPKLCSQGIWFQAPQNLTVKSIVILWRYATSPYLAIMYNSSWYRTQVKMDGVLDVNNLIHWSRSNNGQSVKWNSSSNFLMKYKSICKLISFLGR